MGRQILTEESAAKLQITLDTKIFPRGGREFRTGGPDLVPLQLTPGVVKSVC